MSNKVGAIFILVPLAVFSLILIPSASFAASQTYTTPVSIECDFVTGKGLVKYELLKNGKVLGTTQLDCAGTFEVERSAITTTVKPVDWKMTLKIEDSTGNVMASKVVSGRGLEATASVSTSGQYVFGKIGSAAR